MIWHFKHTLKFSNDKQKPKSMLKIHQSEVIIHLKFGANKNNSGRCNSSNSSTVSTYDTCMISDVSFKSCAQCFNSAYQINGILVDWNHRLSDKSRAVIFWLTHLFGKSHYVILKLMIFSSWSDLNDNKKNWHSTRTSF